MTTYRVTVEVESDIAVDGAAVEALIRRVLEGEDAPANAGVGLLLTGDEQIRQYNHTYRGIDAPTDVLSFEFGEDDDFAGDDGEIGDIVVSLETAWAQAAEHNWGLEAEVAHLVVHGLLHLCGYDHEESEAAEQAMREREEWYLGPLDNVHG